METEVHTNDSGNKTMTNLLSLVQIIFVMAGFLLGGVVVIGNFAYTIQGWFGIVLVPPAFVSAWVLQGLIILVLSFFLMRANDGVQDRISAVSHIERGASFSACRFGSGSPQGRQPPIGST